MFKVKEDVASLLVSSPSDSSATGYQTLRFNHGFLTSSKSTRNVGGHGTVAAKTIL